MARRRWEVRHVGVTPVTIGAAADVRAGVAPEPMRFQLDWSGRYPVSVFSFGLACCAVEFVAASMSRPDIIAPASAATTDPPQATLMIVSGTVTDAMAPAVKRIYDQLPEPRYVISFGSCANSGGPYWDSYCVTKGVDQIIPFDVFVLCCPPRPEALLHGLRTLQDTIDAAGQKTLS
jgi:NADH-quinone oxidoreductase subunit B